MNRAVWVLAACAALGACERPDAERDGFVMVDEEARAAGIRVEVSGEQFEEALPVAVPEGAEAGLVRDGVVERLTVGPGEVVEVVGARGEIRRSSASADQLVVRGDSESVSLFAEMIGARSTAMGGGRYALRGPDALVLATLMGSVPGIRGVGPMQGALPYGAAPAPSDLLAVSFELSAPAASHGAQGGAAAGEATLDAAALVGVYRRGSATMVLDASGGYSVYDGDAEVARGRFVPRAGGVDFLPEGGGAVATMRVSEDRLVDNVGIAFEAPRARLVASRPAVLPSVF